jgi:hypothetical protein
LDQLPVLLLALTISSSVSLATAQEATSVRVADAACARCHAAIFNKYLKTPMANASGVAKERLRPGRFEHTASSVDYTIAEDQGQPTLSYRSLTNPDLSGQLRLEYFLGSGHLGTTYLYSIDNFLFESPVAWYGPTKKYDMKPGLSGMRSMPPPLPMQSECLRCHMSSVNTSMPGTINRYEGLPFLHTGITCEACHGDSIAHVRSGGKAAIVNPNRLNADRRDSVCIYCHLEGDVHVERAGQSALNYRPGDSVSKFLAFYVKAKENITDRGVSEVEQLSQSTCKRMSGDRMSCTSCHDPHYTPPAAEKAAFFRSKCLTCHGQPKFAETHHPEKQDCTSCHMPRTGAENIPHVAWTDHRILKLPDVRPSNGSARETSGGELTPIFSPGANARDLAMANYQALLEGDSTREPAAWAQLIASRDADASDVAVLDALGNMSAERAKTQEAEASFRRVLAVAPNDLTALSNLGVLLAKEGKLTESLTLLQRAFSRNQDLSGLAMNLARVQCIAGEGVSARGTLQATLKFGSNLENVRKLLNGLNDCNVPRAK